MKNTLIKINIICACLAIASLFAGMGYARIDPTTVAGAWLFDEGDGDVVKDLSGNGNDGLLIGKPKWVKGKFGSALEFNGNNYVSVPDSDTLDMEDEITIMFYISSEKKMADMWADRQAVVGKHYLEYEVGIYMDGQLHTYTNDGTGANYDEGIMASIAGKLPDKEADWEKGKWYHIAWTLNKKHEIAYVNGIKVGEYDKAHEGTKPGVHPLEIGRRVEGGISVVGAVDEVIVLNTALEIEEIELAAKEGLQAALGILAVDSAGKLATTWASVKKQ